MKPITEEIFNRFLRPWTGLELKSTCEIGELEEAVKYYKAESDLLAEIFKVDRYDPSWFNQVSDKVKAKKLT